MAKKKRVNPHRIPISMKNVDKAAIINDASYCNSRSITDRLAPHRDRLAPHRRPLGSAICSKSAIYSAGLLKTRQSGAASAPSAQVLRSRSARATAPQTVPIYRNAGFRFTGLTVPVFRFRGFHFPGMAVSCRRNIQ